MARAIWKGQISFGLVNVPVSLHTAEKSNEISFKLLDSRDKSRVRYERVSEATGKEVPWDLIVKGYEIEKDQYVLIDEEELKRAAPEATQTVLIEDFVEEGAIDKLYFDKPYFLVPDKRGERGYALLRETLRKTKRVGIAKVVIRTRQYLAALSTYEDIMVLDLLRYAHEIKSPSEFEVPPRDLEKVKVTKKEVDMAAKLVESMTVEWEPEKYKDDYREALMDWIQKKADAGQEVEVPMEGLERKPMKGKVLDFMSLLQKSLEEKSSAPAKKTRKSAGSRKTASKSSAAARKRA